MVLFYLFGKDLKCVQQCAAVFIPLLRLIRRCFGNDGSQCPGHLRNGEILPAHPAAQRVRPVRCLGVGVQERQAAAVDPCIHHHADGIHVCLGRAFRFPENLRRQILNLVRGIMLVRCRFQLRSQTHGTVFRQTDVGGIHSAVKIRFPILDGTAQRPNQFHELLRRQTAQPVSQNGRRVKFKFIGHIFSPRKVCKLYHRIRVKSIEPTAGNHGQSPVFTH